MTGLGQPRPLFQDDTALQVREIHMPVEDVDAMTAYVQLLQQLIESVRLLTFSCRCCAWQPSCARTAAFAPDRVGSHGAPGATVRDAMPGRAVSHVRPLHAPRLPGAPQHASPSAHVRAPS